MSKVGIKRGMITILYEFEPESRHSAYKKYLLHCDCGRDFIGSYHIALRSKNPHCGCMVHENISKSKTVHGYSREKIYHVWRNMIKRCYDQNSPAYHDYGERGIGVCLEWMENVLKFIEFAKSSGYAEGLTLDRIDNNGNYDPQNCRWVSRKEQGNNKRNNVFICFNGVTMTVSQWANHLCVKRQFLEDRIRRGWSDDEIISGKRYERKKTHDEIESYKNGLSREFIASRKRG